ncbi:uncharacterized protein EI90DRAFT_480581 [Cantharellus anzutake]|uniref:uncharacterized protein n=1 Tax=Cantharellus anzutake TaxID=1750568 RepID=UPI001903ECD6|nr:uncharacterized protein EI90DRAFT_480581 [Cantharellus anzutake]KAF8313969.1 hypothetical protein EI90DRAFT_480581 [Cantharellus anzutake]
MLPLEAPTQARRSSISRAPWQQPAQTQQQQPPYVVTSSASSMSPEAESRSPVSASSPPMALSLTSISASPSTAVAPEANPTASTTTNTPPAEIPLDQLDPIALKRRQNTVAARRSRQRKLEHVRALEAEVVALRGERDALRERCGSGPESRARVREIWVAWGRCDSRTSLRHESSFRRSLLRELFVLGVSLCPLLTPSLFLAFFSMVFVALAFSTGPFLLNFFFHYSFGYDTAHSASFASLFVIPSSLFSFSLFHSLSFLSFSFLPFPPLFLPSWSSYRTILASILTAFAAVP